MSGRRKAAVGAVLVAVAGLALVLLRPDRLREERPGAGPAKPARARSGNEVAWGEAVNGLEVGLSAARRVLRPGNAPGLTILLRNRGSRALHVFDPSWWGHPWRVVFTPVAGGEPLRVLTGRPAPGMGGNIPPAGPVALAPGEEQVEPFTGPLPLSRLHFYAMPVSIAGLGWSEYPPERALPPGRYIVTATYSRAAGRAPEAYWTGTVVTGKIEIEILPQEGAR